MTHGTLAPNPGDRLGPRGEDLAVRYLRDVGMAILDRNWRDGRRGEIDVVARDGRDIVIVEVKTRRDVSFGHPVEAVTRLKAARLRRLTAAWLAEHPHPGYGVRVDVVGILWPADAQPRVRHLRAVLT